MAQQNIKRTEESVEKLSGSIQTARRKRTHTYESAIADLFEESLMQRVIYEYSDKDEANRVIERIRKYIQRNGLHIEAHKLSETGIELIKVGAKEDEILGNHVLSGIQVRDAECIHIDRFIRTKAYVMYLTYKNTYEASRGRSRIYKKISTENLPIETRQEKEIIYIFKTK